MLVITSLQCIVGNPIYHVINGSHWIHVLTVNIFKNYLMIVVLINIREQT